MGIGEFRHVVRVQAPTVAPDGDGGTVETWIDLDPPWPVAIAPATVRDLERQTAGTTVATATHIIHGRYRPDVTVDARVVWGIREFRITGIASPKERQIDLYLFAKETI